MVWLPINIYPLPKKEYDFDYPKALFYSKETGIVVGRCYLQDEDEKLYIFHYDQDGLIIEPTHWMPLPDKP